MTDTYLDDLLDAINGVLLLHEVPELDTRHHIINQLYFHRQKARKEATKQPVGRPPKAKADPVRKLIDAWEQKRAGRRYMVLLHTYYFRFVGYDKDGNMLGLCRYRQPDPSIDPFYTQEFRYDGRLKLSSLAETEDNSMYRALRDVNVEKYFPDTMFHWSD